MPAKNGNIRQFFKPAAKKEEPKDVRSSRLSDNPPTITTNSENVQPPPPLPRPTDTQSFSSEPRINSSQRIIRSSDDEEDESSDSDSSLVDLTELLQSRNTTYRPPSRNSIETPAGSRIKPYKNAQHTSPLTFQPKPKYKFGLKTLVSQSQKHEATEVSAQKAKVLHELGSGQDSAQHSDKEALLESVVAGRDTNNVEKILQAVERTEGTTAEKAWYFFNPEGETPYQNMIRFPGDIAVEQWQKKLVNREDRERSIRSGFIKDMVIIQGELREDLFLWILDAACMEPTEDLRQAYFDILLAAPESIHNYLHPDTVIKTFNRLGTLSVATDLKADIEVVNVCKNAYEKRDWSSLKCIIEFLGDAAPFARPVTCSATLALLARLCVDSLIWDNVSLFSATQNTILQLSEAIEIDSLWQISCQNICLNIYTTVPQAPLCLQILRCIPDSRPRLHELRRRLALSVFCQDRKLTEKPAEKTFKIWELVQELRTPRFKINKETDYVELAATMALLDIAIDNGYSTDLNLSDPEVEKRFNSDVDELAHQIKVIWSSINEVGAMFISRIDAKEVMDGVRNRLMYTVRTRLKPKPSIFDLPEKKEDEEGVRKQSSFMEKHFKKPITNNSNTIKTSWEGDTTIDQTIK